MDILCSLFGHKPQFDRFGYNKTATETSSETASKMWVEKTNLHYAALYTDCERCHARYHVSNVLVPQLYIQDFNRLEAMSRAWNEQECKNFIVIAEPVGTLRESIDKELGITP